MPSSAFKTCALRSEEHTSELQSHDNLVCRLLLEKNILLSRTRPPDSARRLLARGTTTPATLTSGAAAVRRVGWCSEDRWRVGMCALFFKDTATTEIYTLSLHDALPINDTATTEIYTLSLHELFRSRWSPYHLCGSPFGPHFSPPCPRSTRRASSTA